MPFPCGIRAEVATDSRAPQPLRFCIKKLYNFLKRRYPVARRHIVRTVQNLHKSIVRRSYDDRAVNLRFSIEMLPKNRTVPAQKPRGLRTISIESLRRLRDDHTKIARFPCNLLAVSVQFVSISPSRVRNKTARYSLSMYTHTPYLVPTYDACKIIRKTVDENIARFL